MPERTHFFQSCVILRTHFSCRSGNNNSMNLTSAKQECSAFSGLRGSAGATSLVPMVIWRKSCDAVLSSLIGWCCRSDKSSQIQSLMGAGCCCLTSASCSQPWGILQERHPPPPTFPPPHTHPHLRSDQKFPSVLTQPHVCFATPSPCRALTRTFHLSTMTSHSHQGKINDRRHDVFPLFEKSAHCWTPLDPWWRLGIEGSNM